MIECIMVLLMAEPSPSFGGENARRTKKNKNKANFQMAEHMGYGYKTGCEFLNDKCMDKGKTKWPNMFCDATEDNEVPEFCTTDRLGFGDCALNADYNSSFPSHFQYFTSDIKGGYYYFFTDYCPVMEPHTNSGCGTLRGQGEMPGNLFGKNSMCLDGSALKVQVSSGTVSVNGVCVEISCEGSSVKVKYLGDKDTWHDCPEGQSLTPSSTSKSFESGEIKCPKYEEVCTVAPDGSILVPKVLIELSQDPTASDKPTGKPNDSTLGVKSKDGGAVPFGLIPSVAFLVLSLAGCLIA